LEEKKGQQDISSIVLDEYRVQLLSFGPPLEFSPSQLGLQHLAQMTLIRWKKRLYDFLIRDMLLL
jgi:hypothetical protein